ncbi:hypothetical protein K469DRAFT_727212 [Zopfia rhizophila CBS 207.26]|uniref:Uncharacterized protein n=1 Tax=Zopfia rhizophila CBS 207.26 TaxID=1314779 RepID=A0A6A6DZ00_9PEZI|nr:hypothetical protein K469DRAFT_727212 [Zopfia rhizophila CBS 207.26]
MADHHFALPRHLFAIIIIFAVRIQKDYLSEHSGKSEMVMVANRSMWINETVFSYVMCYFYGIAAPMWFRTGFFFQIALMTVLDVLVKIRISNAHTSLEIVRYIYSRLGHIIFIFINMNNNIIGCASLIVTGSQLLYGMTVVHLTAATVLIRWSIMLYTAVGGLKATFLTDFLHTTIALILTVYFTIAVLTNEHVGATAVDHYVKGNCKGWLLSFKSKGAILSSIALKFGNLALVVMDTAFRQKSFAPEVRSTVPSYNLAALAIFAVPWALSGVIGLTARGVEKAPVFPTSPEGFIASQVSAGFVTSYTIRALLGPRGSAGILLLLYMSVASTLLSTMIAVSSILAFDFHLGVNGHGIFITCITTALDYGGADLTWMAYCLPILTCPNAFPLIFTLFWGWKLRLAVIVLPILGMVSSITI